MSFIISTYFKSGAYKLVSGHNPLVLKVQQTDTTATRSSGSLQATIQGQTGCDNTTAYTFDLAHIVTYSIGGGYYDHFYELDVTNIINKIANKPYLKDATTSGYKATHRLASKIRITVIGDGTEYFENWYCHGFNQLNNANGSALVEFANPAGGSVYPIAPGVPMLLGVYNQTYHEGDDFIQISGTGFVGLTIGPMSGLAEGLYQVYDTELNEDFYLDGYSIRPKLYDLELVTDGSVTLGKTTLVALRKACIGDVVLCWLNRYGVYSYMAFDKRFTKKLEGKEIGTTNVKVDTLVGNQSRVLSRGKENVREVIDAIAMNVPTEYLPIIEDLFYSMDVYLYTGVIPNYSHDDTDWLRVRVDGSLPARSRSKHENVRVTIYKPDLYTQTR